MEEVTASSLATQGDIAGELGLAAAHLAAAQEKIAKSSYNGTVFAESVNSCKERVAGLVGIVNAD